MADESPTTLKFGIDEELFVKERSGFLDRLMPSFRLPRLFLSDKEGNTTVLGEVKDFKINMKREPPFEVYGSGPIDGRDFSFEATWSPTLESFEYVNEPRLSAGTIQAGRIQAGSISVPQLANGFVQSQPTQQAPLWSGFYEQLPPAADFIDGALILSGGKATAPLAYRKVGEKGGGAWSRASNVGPTGCAHEFDSYDVCQKCRCSKEFIETACGLRCEHEINPVSHDCRKCGAQAWVLEQLAESCIDGKPHEMHFDHLGSCEYFCDRCGLTEAQVELLSKPVIAGDEAAREELTRLPVLEIEELDRNA